MPPGDTVIYEPGKTGPPPAVGNAFADSVVRLTWQEIKAQPQKNNNSDGTWQMIVGISIIFFLVVFQKWLGQLPEKIKAKRKQIRIGKEVDAKGLVYNSWLELYNPYYNGLSTELRDRFLKRTIEFMGSKEFRFHYMEPEEQVLVLVSGAAVQLTFGLKRFLIEYFPVINVIKREYSVVGRDKILEGHVQANNQTINISWNNFIEDYTDYTDSENLGLHEMAHAISFDFLYGNHENRNVAFMARFKEYIQNARPVFKDLCQGRNDLLDDYGSLNVEEFWAVCIESFFENSEEFSRKIPDLYLAVADVLNQDPLKPGKILDKELAGLAN